MNIEPVSSTLAFLAAFWYTCFHVSNLQTRLPVGVFSLVLVALIIWCIDTFWSNGASRSVMPLWRALKSVTSRRQPEDDDDDEEKARKPSEESTMVAGNPQSFADKMRKASRKWSWGGNITVRSPTGDATGNLNGSSRPEDV